MTWLEALSPKDIGYGNGWCSELDCAWVDLARKYAVMSRQIETDWGIIEHVCIRNQANTDIPWSEKQRIKNELFGEGAIAIEVYPSQDKLVNDANMYHLWIMPKGFDLPFGIHADDTQCKAQKRK